MRGLSRGVAVLSRRLRFSGAYQRLLSSAVVENGEKREDLPPLDTHAAVKRLERSGFTPSQAEAATEQLCAVLLSTLARLEAKYLPRHEAERVRETARFAAMATVIPKTTADGSPARVRLCALQS